MDEPIILTRENDIAFQFTLDYLTQEQIESQQQQDRCLLTDEQGMVQSVGRKQLMEYFEREHDI